MVSEKKACPRCGGERIVRAGYSRLKAGLTQRYKCQSCQFFMMHPLMVEDLQGTFIPIEFQPAIIAKVRELNVLISQEGTVQVLQEAINRVGPGRVGG